MLPEKIFPSYRKFLNSSQDMLTLWKNAHSIKPENNLFIKNEVKDSWDRSYNYAVSPHLKKNHFLLSEEELKKKRENSKHLIEIALPTMQSLYEFVKESGFIVVLSDADCVMLLIMGDQEGLNFARRGNVIEGSIWKEELIGTNAICLAIIENKPIQILGYEHFGIYGYNATCSSAPIHGPDFNIIGVLNITGPFDKVHYHTLGMVVAGVDAIEKQMALKKTLEENILAHKYKTYIVESMREGVLAIDIFGYIIHINRSAASLLHLNEKDVAGCKLADLLVENETNQHFINLIRSKRCLVDTSVTIVTKQERIKCIVNSNPIIDHDGTEHGKVIILQKYKRAGELYSHLVIPRSTVTFDDLIGQEDNFLNALRLARAASAGDCTVLLLGESGTGKDLFAQVIHNASIRAKQPFIPINCSTIPRDLITSELFGYDEGAFTGAKRGGNPGKFQLADQGTIFLDEIGDMPVDLQATLLRVLEERQIIRLGGKEYNPINVRIIAATNKDLDVEIKKGYFRQDLFFRLSVMTIHLPPLRERKGDIERLALYFLKRISERLGKKIHGFAPEVKNAFLDYTWPGNIRELNNVIEAAVNLTNGEFITLEFLPPALTNLNGYKPTKNTKIESIQTMEEKIIRNCLIMCKNKSEASRHLGISRSTLYRKIKEYGLEDFHN